MPKANSKGSPKVFIKSAKACLANAQRLLDDAELMELEKPPTTALSLSILSQEESAKAFLLYLIASGAIPWNQYVRRSLNDHRSKQLMTIILDRFNPCDEEWDRYFKSMKLPSQDDFIHKIGDVLNIYYYEKIERWGGRTWNWDNDLHYDPKAKRIHDGSIDRIKQSAIYIKIGKDGQAFPVTASKVQLEEAKNAAKRYQGFVSDLIAEDKVLFQDWLTWLKDTFRLFFESSIYIAPGRNTSKS